MTVTGWTPGTAAKRIRPAAAAPPSTATSATSLDEPGPDSSHAKPVAMSANATRSSDTAASFGDRAAHAPPSNPAAAPAKSAFLDPGRLLDGPQPHRPIGDVGCEDRVVSDDEGRPAAG